MKIKFAGTVAAVLFGLSVSAAGAQSAPVKLRFGHAHPVTDSQHVAALEFARKVKERTQGGIDIQIFGSKPFSVEIDFSTNMTIGGTTARH